MRDDHRILQVLAALGVALFAVAIGVKAHAQSDPNEYADSLMKTPYQPPAMPQVIRPNGSWVRGGATAQRDQRGYYSFEAAVNGAPVQMVFDTGATHVTLRAEDAARVGIDVNSLNYSAGGDTANGKGEFARITIATFTVGSITRRNVPAIVAKPGKLASNLLGQTFLSRLTAYRQDGNRLTLQGE